MYTVRTRRPGPFTGLLVPALCGLLGLVCPATAGEGAYRSGPALERWPVRSLVAHSSDGKVRAWVGDGPTLHLCNGMTGQELRQVQCADAVLDCVALTSDGRLVAAVDQVGTIYVWEAATGTEVRRLAGPEGMATALAFSPSGKILVTAGNQPQDALGLWVNGGLCAWEVATGKEIRQLRTLARPIVALAFTSQGRAVTCATGGGVLRWEPSTGKEEGGEGARRDSPFEITVHYDPEIVLTGATVAGATEPGEGPWSGAQRKALWTGLADPDPARAYEVVGRLLAAPGVAESFLGESLRPVPADLEGRVGQLVREMDDRSWSVRERADAELANLGEVAEGYLRKVQQKPPSLEVSRRVERLLERIEQARPSPGSLRGQRAVEALEELGTPEAREVLLKLAAGAPTASLTRDAQGALTRLGGR